MDSTQFQKIGNHIEAISYAYFDEEYDGCVIGNHIETISYAYFDEEYDEEDNMLAALHEMAWKLVNLTRPEDKPWI
jgi:hypothetical protein